MNQPYMLEATLDGLTELRRAATFSDCHFWHGIAVGRLCAMTECGALTPIQAELLGDLARNAFSHAIKEASK
jgi:hypothetical protein